MKNIVDFELNKTALEKRKKEIILAVINDSNIETFFKEFFKNYLLSKPVLYFKNMTYFKQIISRDLRIESDIRHQQLLQRICEI